MSDIRVTVPPLEDLREAFAKFDTANDGVIPVHDLGALLRSVGVVEQGVAHPLWTESRPERGN